MNIPAEIRKAIFIGTLAAAALFLAAALWTERSFRRLENEVETAKVAAAASERRMAATEAKAAAYTEKITFLESQIREADEIKRRQNENISKQNDVVRSVRGRVERARRTRTIDAGAVELCEKLEKLGHGC